MTEFAISGAGRLPSYPQHYGAHFKSTTATLVLDSDLINPSAEVLAMPNCPVTVLNAGAFTITPQFFGMHAYQRINDGMSGVTVGTVRNQDMEGGKSRWSQIEWQDNAFTWGDVDSWVNTHYAAGREIIFLLWGTPAFHSARSTEVGAYGVGSLGASAEPADMTKWTRYCTKVAQRYLGKVKYYEVWNEPNYRNDGVNLPNPTTPCYFTGTFAKLAEMTRLAAQAVKAVDPTVKIISPSMTDLQPTGADTAGDFFKALMDTATGDGSTKTKDWVDIIAIHLYLSRKNSVQELPAMIDRFKANMVTAGVSSKELWDTESAPIGPAVPLITDPLAGQLMARHLITCAAKGVARTIYYQWDRVDMGYKHSPGINQLREYAVSLLSSGTCDGATMLTDGRVILKCSAGQIVL